MFLYSARLVIYFYILLHLVILLTSTCPTTSSLPPSLLHSTCPTTSSPHPPPSHPPHTPASPPPIHPPTPLPCHPSSFLLYPSTTTSSPTSTPPHLHSPLRPGSLNEDSFAQPSDYIMQKSAQGLGRIANEDLLRFIATSTFGAYFQGLPRYRVSVRKECAECVECVKCAECKECILQYQPSHVQSSTPHYFPLDTPTPHYFPLDTPIPHYFPLATPTTPYFPLDTPTPHYFPIDTPTPHYFPIDTPTTPYSPLATPTPPYYNPCY